MWSAPPLAKQPALQWAVMVARTCARQTTCCCGFNGRRLLVRSRVSGELVGRCTHERNVHVVQAQPVHLWRGGGLGRDLVLLRGWFGNAASVRGPLRRQPRCRRRPGRLRPRRFRSWRLRSTWLRWRLSGRLLEGWRLSRSARGALMMNASGDCVLRSCVALCSD